MLSCPFMGELTSFFPGKKILITGGLGFIGSNLARTLSGLDAEVTLADNLFPDYGGNRFNISGFEDKVTSVICDVRDEAKIRNLIEGKDILFNLAGQTSHLDSMQDPYTDFEINCHAQLSILEACRKHNPGIKIVYAGTRQIYGKPDYLPVNENHPLRPVDVNGIHKMAAEQYHLLYNQASGVRTCCLRLTNTIGPRMRTKDARQTFVGIWIRHLIENKPFEVWEGSQKRDFTDVDDAVRAFLLCASSEKSNGQIYNLGGERVITLKDLADLMIRIHGKGSYELKEFPLERKNIDIGDYYADFNSIRETLGWEPEISLPQTLEKTLDYYRKYPAQYFSPEATPSGDRPKHAGGREKQSARPAHRC